MIQKLTLSIYSVPGTAVRTWYVFTLLILIIAWWGLSLFCSWRNWGRKMSGNQGLTSDCPEYRMWRETSQNWCCLHVADTLSASCQSTMLLNGYSWLLLPCRRRKRKIRGSSREETGEADGLRVKQNPLLHTIYQEATSGKQMPGECVEHFQCDPTIM